MPDDRTFSVKFTSSGLKEVLQASQKVSRSYSDWLESAEKAIAETDELLDRQSKNLNQNADEIAKLERDRTRASRNANNAISASYRELGIRSRASIESQKKQAISAYEAIKRSGVGSSQDLERAAQALDRKLQSLERQLDDVEDEAREAGGEFTILKGTLAGIASNAITSGLSAVGRFIGGITGQISQAVISADQLRTQLSQITGSEEAGAAEFERLDRLSDRTKETSQELIASFISLRNRGIEPTEKEIIQLSDFAASQGKSIQQFVEAVLDAQTGENERLKEFGIRAEKDGDRVRFTFRGITTEVENSEEAIKDYLTELGSLDGIAGTGEKLAGSIQGILTNFQSASQRIFRAVGAIFEPLFQQVGQPVVNLINSISQDIGPLLEPITAAVQNIFDAIAQSVPGLESIESVIKGGIAQAAQFIANLLNTIAGIIRNSRSEIQSLGESVSDLVTGAFSQLANLATNLVSTLEENPSIINEMVDKVADLLSTLSKILPTALQLAKVILSIVAAFAVVNEATNGWLLNLGLIAIAAAKIIPIVTSIIAGVTATAAAWGTVTAAIGTVITAIVGIVTGIAAVVAAIVATPAVLIAAAVAAIAAVLVLIYKFRDEIVGALTKAWQIIAYAAVKTWAQSVESWGTLWNNLVRSMLERWAAIVAAFKQGWQDFIDKAGGALKAVNLLLTPFGSIQKIGVDIGKSIAGWSNPIKKAKQGLDAFLGGFKKILGLSEDVGTDVGQKLDSTATGGPLIPAPSGSFDPSRFPITSPFGPRNGRLHAGVDYGTPQGTPLANIFGAGVITIASNNVDGYGGLIELTTANGDVYRFGHMSRINVRRGQRVPAGALMGLTGGAPGTQGAGRSTGPHLHLEYYPGGGAPVPFNTTRGRGRGGPEVTKPKASKRPESVKVKLDGETVQFNLSRSDTQPNSLDIDTEIKTAREILDRALTSLGANAEESEAIASIKSKYEDINQQLKEAEEKYTRLIAVRKELKEDYEAETKALKEIGDARARASRQQDIELAQAKELIQLRGQLNRASNLQSLAGLESDATSLRVGNAVRSGQLSQFQADSLLIERRIVEQQASFASELAQLRVERAEATDTDTREYLDQVIERITELNGLKLDALQLELTELAKAQEEATRILPTAKELAGTITGVLRDIPSQIIETIKGAQSLGETILGFLGNLAQRVGNLFLDKAFSGLEGILGGVFSGGLKLSRGGVIPGFGGGDRVPATLERGEGVLRKEVVSQIGADRIQLANANPQFSLDLLTPQALFTSPSTVSTATQATTTNNNRQNNITINYQVDPAQGTRPTERQTAHDLQVNLNRYNRG